jgi:TPR repeat protein
MHKLFIAALISIVGIASNATAAACQEPQLESVSSTDTECYFYKGTKHFRAKEYSAALNEWLAIVDKTDIPVEFEHFRASAQNNIGFLYYMGWGVKQNSEIAIERYWLPAEKAGHEEAAYHLCHAYADEGNELALGHCREALRRYNKGGSADSEDSEVVAQLREYIAHLEAR